MKVRGRRWKGKVEGGDRWRVMVEKGYLGTRFGNEKTINGGDYVHHHFGFFCNLFIYLFYL